MKKLLSQIIACSIGLWLATLFVSGVSVSILQNSAFFGVQLTAQWQIFLLLGISLGLLNYFVKPMLKLIALPLEIITLGLFTLVINMGLLWVLDKIFNELYISQAWSLLYTALIVWALNLIIQKILIKKD